MDQKKVLIVGAGPAQYSGIAKAKKMGLFTIVADRDENAPGLGIADVPLVVDVKDIASLIQVARQYHIDGVFLVSSEVSVMTVAAIAEELNLPGIGTNTARIATDKGLMREIYLENGVPSPEFKIVHSLGETYQFIKKLSLPVVLKPADNAGSRGVTLVIHEDEIEDAYLRAMSNSNKNKVLVESFMDGIEVSVEAFVYKGDITILALSDKIRTPPPYLLDTMVIFPSNFPKATLNDICDVAVRAIKSVGIDNGPVHIEIMMTDNGPKMVELAARGPGFKVFTEMIPFVTGVDVVEGVIKLAIGEEPDLNVIANRAAVLKFIEANPGKIEKITGLEKVKTIKGVHDFDFYLSVNDIIKPVTCGDDRIGHIITYADSREKALEIVEMAERLLEIDVLSLT